jgi:hypothetical protein
MLEDAPETEGKGGKVDVDEGQGRAEKVGSLLISGEDEGRQVGLQEGERGGRRG